jgi:serine/threonine protein phosphatase PrpC
VLATAGLRGVDKMEDAHCIMSPLTPHAPHAHLFAVFDGHRGAEAARFAAASLPLALAAAWGAPDAQPQASLAKAFVSVDAAFRAVDAARAAGEAADSAASGAPPRPARHPGATAIAALIWGDALYIANAGDCRAMLCRDGCGAALTRDHTAEDPGERARITACGGTVARHGAAGKWRVGDAAIAVTRGIGDFDLREAGLTPEPEITRVDITPDDEFILVACDGLWDVMDVEDVIALVQSTVKEPSMVVKRIVAEALTRGSSDNITVIIAFLQPVCTLEKAWAADDAAQAAAACAR